jgi:hypothetical protein
VGLICHPAKLKSPAPIQKFCGFLYDSEGTPKLRIPNNKVIRALVLLEFLTRGSRKIICHLAFSVAVGTLQSLVPATPNAIGAYLLHHVYQSRTSLIISKCPCAEYQLIPSNGLPDSPDQFYWVKPGVLDNNIGIPDFLKALLACDFN